MKILKKVRLIVTTAFGLEAVAKGELQNMGFNEFTVSNGKIEFDADIRHIPMLNINLRAADRVLVKVGEFPAITFTELFDGTKDLPWHEWIPADGRILVAGKSVRSQLASVRSCQSIVNKSVVESLKEKLNVQVLPETGAEYNVRVSLLNDRALLTLDTSGNGLHKRGYREAKGEVPLRENLAAALVLLSFWDENRILIDPMCGSGTILIEAAMIARNIAPGLKRDFISEQWPAIHPKFWKEARTAARKAEKSDIKLNIQGFDNDPDRIKDCLINARNAGVEKDISFAVKDIRDLWIDRQYGVLITNPPYGVKLGNFRDINPLYVSIHHTFKKKKGWSIYFLTADTKFPDYFKRARPDKVRKLYNGKIEVNYYQYFGERPPDKTIG